MEVLAVVIVATLLDGMMLMVLNMTVVHTKRMDGVKSTVMILRTLARQPMKHAVPAVEEIATVVEVEAAVLVEVPVEVLAAVAVTPLDGTMLTDQSLTVLHMKRMDGVRSTVTTLRTLARRLMKLVAPVVVLEEEIVPVEALEVDAVTHQDGTMLTDQSLTVLPMRRTVGARSMVMALRTLVRQPTRHAVLVRLIVCKEE